MSEGAEQAVDLGPRVDAAAKVAVRDALRFHKLIGNRVPVWRGGQVAWLESEAIPESGPVCPEDTNALPRDEGPT